MNSKKFKYPLAISGTTEQLEALVPQLEALGYKWTSGARDDHGDEDYDYLVTDYENHEVGLGYYHKNDRSIEVSADETAKVLHLAAAVDDERVWEGELMFCHTTMMLHSGGHVNDTVGFIAGDYYTAIDDNVMPLKGAKGLSVVAHWQEHFRKATFEEILQYHSGPAKIARMVKKEEGDGAFDNVEYFGEFGEPRKVLPPKQCASPANHNDIEAETEFDLRAEVEALKRTNRELGVKLREADEGVLKAEKERDLANLTASKAIERYDAAKRLYEREHSDRAELTEWKKGALDTIARWDKVDEWARGHKDIKLDGSVIEFIYSCLIERDKLIIQQGEVLTPIGHLTEYLKAYAQPKLQSYQMMIWILEDLKKVKV